MVDLLDNQTEQGQPIPDHGENGYEAPDFNLILGAPDFAELFKRTKSATAREYEKKAASAFKAVAVGSIQAGNWPDAATFLWHGPGAASAVGQIADASPKAKAAIDMLTAPDSPWLIFAVTMMPMMAQILRNHEAEIQELPSKWKLGKKARAARKAKKQDMPQEPPRFTIKIGRKQIPVRFRIRFKLLKGFVGGVRSQTQEPNVLAARVFTDPGLIKALNKLGVNIKVQGDGNV